MRIDWKLPLVAAAGMAIGAVGGISYAKDEAKKQDYNLVPHGTAKYAPVDPKQPKGLQMSLVSGDPKTGPVALFLKIPKGAAPTHWHTSDYYAVTLEGDTRHWWPADKGKDAKALKPGSAWFQPGGNDKTAHGDECLSEWCIAFLMFPGKFDANFLPAPKK